MEIKSLTATGGTTWLKRAACGLLLGWLLAQAGQAAPAPLFQNLFDNTYNEPGGPYPPTISATNFDNEALFNVNLSPYVSKPVFYYEPSYILNYTNGENGILEVGSTETISTTGATTTTLLTTVSALGFQFDKGSSTEGAMAGTFYNQGSIWCDSSLADTILTSGVGSETLQVVGSGLLIVTATNIIIPGNIDVGEGGNITLTGQDVDLSRAVLNVDGLQTTTVSGTTLETLNVPTLASTGVVGVDTNGDWDPSVDLTATEALSGYITTGNAANTLTFDFLLYPSQAYFQENQTGPSNIIYEAVFVENASTNANYNVYFDATNSTTTDLQAHVEWVGTYTDPVTASPISSYLYLSDDYVLGATTNAGGTLVPVFNGTGIPENFTFNTSPIPLYSNPVTESFLNVFPSGIITNRYSYMEGQLMPATVVTNADAANPHGTISNLGSSIFINASQNLNLQSTIISGENYLSIVATNNFEGAQQAQITAPYSDINLGVSSGALNFTNVLQSAIPAWSGTIEAWSTCWTNLDKTTGITNIFRVLLVYGDVNPLTAPYVNTLQLHGGTNLVISDILNVYGSFYTDAQRMSLTTNGVGVGASSPEGQLNTIYQGNLGLGNWPNLRWLTNNGTLSALGSISLTNAANFSTVINNGSISDLGTTIFATNFSNGGTINNGSGNFNLQSQTAVLTNSTLYAGGSITMEGRSLLVSNVSLQSLSLTLIASNSLSDGGINNGSTWTVGRGTATGGGGLKLLSTPASGDLLGTIITDICPAVNKATANIWAGTDYGAVNLGFTNNAAVGQLILDPQGAASLITFNGAGTSNALYVDSLVLMDSATGGVTASYDFTNWVALNPNITIYFAQATANGVSVAEKINKASLYSGKNGGTVDAHGNVTSPGRLRWVPTYAGHFSSTNIVVNGVTNTVNAALAQSPDIDSNGNGIANAFDPNPFFTSAQINFGLTITNQPSRQAVLTWDTVPLATNYVYYTSNLLTGPWQLFTNFNSVSATGPAYPVTVTDTNILKGIRFYKVMVSPWLTYPY